MLDDTTEISKIKNDLDELKSSHIRLEGKLDRIADKLDDKFDRLAAEIIHGDKETQALYNLLKQELDHVKKQTSEEQTKLEIDVSTLEGDFKGHHERLEKRVSDLEQFKWKLVGAAVSLGAIFGGITGGIVKGLVR